MELDKALHLVGGLFVAYSVAGALQYLTHKNAIVLQDRFIFQAVVFGSVCFAVIAWEIMEFILIPFFTYRDTVMDMIYGLCGGSIYTIRRSICLK